MISNHPLDRLFAALSAGTVADTAGCFTPDAAIWHSFDRIELSVSESIEQWRAMIGQFPQRRVENVRRLETVAGCVQQHDWIASTADGREMGWPVCIVAQIEDRRITRLDEYIDRAGWFTP